MYAIAYDFDTNQMELILGPSYRNAYSQFKRFLKKRGFTFQQCSLLYGDPSVTSVSAVLAIQDAAVAFPWLQHCVTDIRILQVMSNDDMRSAITTGARIAGQASSDVG